MAVDAYGCRASIRVELEAELGCNHDLVADVFESLADQLLIGPWSVDLGRIKKADAAVDGFPQKRDLVLVSCVSVIGRAQPHAAEADLRHFKSGFAECSSLHA